MTASGKFISGLPSCQEFDNQGFASTQHRSGTISIKCPRTMNCKFFLIGTAKGSKMDGRRHPEFVSLFWVTISYVQAPLITEVCPNRGSPASSVDQ